MRSADLESAVSPSCTRRRVALTRAIRQPAAAQNAILRYSRLKICATRWGIAGLEQSGVIAARGDVPAAAGPVGVVRWRVGWIVNALVGVRPEVVALGLQQVG